MLEYDSPLTTDTMADRVFGQGSSFTSGGCNLGGISASSRCIPALEYDAPLATPTPTPTCTPGGTGECPTSTPTSCGVFTPTRPTPTLIAAADTSTVTPTSKVTPTVTPTPTCTPIPTVTPTETFAATPTPGPGLHDARLKKISASSSVVLSNGTPDVKNIVVQVRNEGDHTESIGVYVDVIPPGRITNPYGCTPFGRVIDTVVTLGTSNQNNQTSVTATLSFNCADVAGALNQTYMIMAVADAHADDGGACGPFQLQSMTCFNALADDDNDSTDNRATTNGFAVK